MTVKLVHLLNGWGSNNIGSPARPKNAFIIKPYQKKWKSCRLFLRMTAISLWINNGLPWLVEWCSLGPQKIRTPSSIQHTSKFEYPPTKMQSTSLPKDGGIHRLTTQKKTSPSRLKHQRSVALHIRGKATLFCFQLYVWRDSRLCQKKN